MNNKKFLAIDGNSILNRAFYGIKNLSNSKGMPTNAVFGMINILLKQLESIKPEFVAVAFDLKGPTFRHKEFADYKANRKGMPEELAVQLPYAKKAMEALGLTNITVEGFEADDILGTIAKKFENTHDVYILTGDKDSLQLITDTTSVVLATNTEPLLFDELAFTAKYGVAPSQFVDVKALMGDSSDNIPGVAGIGEKTALKLISDYGSLTKIYEDISVLAVSDGVKKKLENGRESAFVSQKLAQIYCDIDSINAPENFVNKGLQKDLAAELFTELEFTNLIKKFGLNQVPKAASESVSREPVEELSDDISRVYIHLDDEFLYTTKDGTNITKEEISSENISKFFDSKTEEIVCYDYKTILHKLDKRGISTEHTAKILDIMLLAYVKDSGSSSFDIAKLVLENLKQIVDENANPLIYYKDLFTVIFSAIKDNEDLLKLALEIEIPLAKVLFDMEKTGFKVDTEGLESYSKKLQTFEGEYAARIFFAAGEEFNINSPKQLGEILFEKLGLPTFKKTKTGYSTGAEVLAKLRHYSPIIDDILQYRQVSKLRSTFADGLIKVATSEGRIHSSFKQTGTTTGRISSVDPNLQNIPIRTELGHELRKYFTAKNSDYILIDADYSQIELRLLADISKDENMIEAFKNGADIHTSTASKVFNVPSEHVTSELRKRAKAVNFGIVYGMGEFSLSEDLKISIAQAKAYIRSYFDGFPMVEKYLSDTVGQAVENGYVTTLFGRRRYIPELSSSNKNIKNFGQRIAMNSPLQGSAADIIKIAMVNTFKRLNEAKLDAKLILQVHDELVIESHKSCADEAMEILKTEMENATKLSVPLIVDIVMAESWFV